MKKILLIVAIFFATLLNAQNYSKIYLVGDAFNCGWSHENSYLMTNEGSGIHTWKGKMKNGDFKFLLKTDPNDQWINCLNSKIANEKVVINKAHDIVYVENSRESGADNKFDFKDNGFFKITINTENMTMAIEDGGLISVSNLDGKGRRIVSIHSCSGKTSDTESPYKLIIGEDENLKSKDNKWCYNGANPYVIFSLSNIYSISKFGFRDGRVLETDANVKNIPEYKVYVSTTGVEAADWTEVIHETNVGGQNVKEKEITPVDARYIKLELVKDPADNYVRIYGVDIYGSYLRSWKEENNISTGKNVVDYHSAWGNRETPANLLDGNKVSVAGADESANPWAFGKSDKAGWVIIDLENRYNVEKFTLTDNADWITGCRLYVSDFAGKYSGWKLIYDGTFNKEDVTKEGQIEEGMPAGRYLKLEIPAEYQTNITRIREFEVYGTVNTDPLPATTTINTDNTLLKEAYDLAVWTVGLNTTTDGILKAGAAYPNKWTRDLAINVWNGYYFLNPEMSKNSLLSLLQDNEEQRIGEEYWDKIIWVKGAYIYWQATGDDEFLAQAFKSGMNTMKELENMVRDGNKVFDAEYGLFTGPSVFNDGIAGYEVPVYSTPDKGGAVVSYPAHNKIKCLSTNCIYYEAYRLLGEMAEMLGKTDKITELETKATNLKANIRKHLFNAETGKVNYLIDQNGKTHEHQEGLGIAFSIMFDILTADEAKKVIAETHITKYGLPSVYPCFERFSEEKPGRHNVMIWPFVNGFFADACVKVKNYDKFKFELMNLADLGVNKGNDNFYEIYEPTNGTPDGGWQESRYKPLEHQTWSATGFLNMVWNGLAGMQLEDEKITFSPYLPKEINNIELKDLRYGSMMLNVKVTGEGTKIKEFKANGITSSKYEISRELTGVQDVEIVMEIDPTVGVVENSLNELPYTLYIKDKSVQVNLANDAVASIVEVYDVSGRCLESKFNAKESFWVAENLLKGVYILKMMINDIQYSTKMTITA